MMEAEITHSDGKVVKVRCSAGSRRSTSLNISTWRDSSYVLPSSRWHKRFHDAILGRRHFGALLTSRSDAELDYRFGGIEKNSVAAWALRCMSMNSLT